jgi:hypothetical protein
MQIPETIVNAAQKNPVLGIAASRAVTEICSIAAYMGAAHVLNHTIEIKPAKHVLAKVITPVIGAIDWTADNVCGALESNEETSARQIKETPERAYHYANVLINSSIRTGIAVGLQIYLMKHLDEKLHINIDDAKAPYAKAAAWDTSIQIGGGFMFTSIFGKQNEALQDGLQHVMEKTGMPVEHANKFARDAVCMALPNLAGALASVVSLSRAYGK